MNQLTIIQQHEKMESYTLDLTDVVAQAYNLRISVTWEAEVKRPVQGQLNKNSWV